MAHKKRKGPAPVPPGNQPQAGPPVEPVGRDAAEHAAPPTTDGASFQEQDAKRRLGNYTGAGEHSYVQPGGLNDANH